MLGRNLAKAPWRVLGGLDEPYFGFQRELFLFQLKFWLTGPDHMKVAFDKAATYFALHTFQEGLKQYRGSPSWKMRQLLNHPSYRGLYDYGYVKNNPVGVLGLPELEEQVEWRDRHRVFMQADAHYALCRLALIVEKDEHRKSWADDYYEKHRPKGPDGIVGLSKRDEYQGFRNKAAYLAAASLMLPCLLDFGVNSYLISEDDVPDPRDFRLFCMHTRAISEKLDCPGSTQLWRWTELEALMPELSKIPESFISTWSPKVRRSAKTTALCDRGRRPAQPKTPAS